MEVWNKTSNRTLYKTCFSLFGFSEEIIPLKIGIFSNFYLKNKILIEK